MNGTEAAVRRLVNEIAALPMEIPADADLYLQLGMASVHAVELLLAIEEHFGLQVPDEAFTEATTIAKLTALIEDELRSSPE